MEPGEVSEGPLPTPLPSLGVRAGVISHFQGPGLHLQPAPRGHRVGSRATRWLESFPCEAAPNRPFTLQTSPGGGDPSIRSIRAGLGECQDGDGGMGM